MSTRGEVSGNSATESRVLHAIQSHKSGTWIEDLARELHLSRMTVSRYVTALERLGLIQVQREGTMKRLYPKVTMRTRGGG